MLVVEVDRTDQDYQDMARAIAAIERREAAGIREGAGLSKSEMARRVGVTHVAIIRWERGEQQPRGDLAVAYGRELRKLTEQRNH